MWIPQLTSRALSGTGVALLAAAIACTAAPATKAQTPTLTIEKDGKGGITIGKKDKEDPKKDNVLKVLTQAIPFQGINDPKESLEEALRFLSRTYGLQSDINERAFAADGLTDPGQELIADPEIPAMQGVALHGVLKRILARLHPRSGATYLVRANHIEITTNAAARAEIWGPDFKGPYSALVNLKVSKTRLSDALNQLAGPNDLNIVCLADSDKEVTATLANVPVDTAVRLLANQAGLTMIQWDNVFLVTTAQQAATLMKEFRELAPALKTPAEYHLWRCGHQRETQLVPSSHEKADLLMDIPRESIKYAGLNDPKATLADALYQLKRQYQVEFDINVLALKADGAHDGDATLISEREIPPLEGTFDHLLRVILARVPAKSGATYVIRGDHIEITTRAAIRLEVWGSKYDGPYLPLINLRVKGSTLTEALDQLAEENRINVAYLAGPTKVVCRVNARLTNVPADTAVRVLAAEAGLIMMQRDNVLQVMTPEQAVALKKELLQEGPDSIKVRRGSVVQPLAPAAEKPM